MRVRPTRRRAALALASITALTLVVSGCAADESVEIDVPAQVDAALPEATATELEAAITHAMAATGSSGAIVGVWAPWSGSLVKGFGVESPSDSSPVTTEMEFRVAQVTRAMTCDVLYAVAEEGTVRVDDRVSEWVTGVPDLSDVTLGQLCDSTSGVGSYSAQLAPLFLSNPTRVWNPRELASYGLGQPRTTEPGARYRASDAGYLLLATALENATGRSSAELFEDHVFDPLDLTATQLPDGVPAAAGPGPVLTGLYSQKDADGVMNCADPRDVTEMSASSGFTDSGVVSNIRDLGRYVQSLASGAILPEGVDRFEEPYAVYDGAPSWYNTRGGAILAGSLIGQYGSVPGYTVAAYSDPESGLTVALVLNNSGGGSGFGTYLAWELAAIASKAPAASGAEAPEAGLPWTAEQYHQAIAAAAICPLPAE